MDGFHYSRAELRDISKNSNGALTYDDLLARRGSPWTFDAKVSTLKDINAVNVVD
jgi:pantothenate kinase